jgi:hypothetical protein
MHSTHEEIERRVPRLNYCAYTPGPACRMQLPRLHGTNAAEHHMPVDAHAGGDRATCLLTRHTLTSLTTHVWTATPAGTASAYVRSYVC